MKKFFKTNIPDDQVIVDVLKQREMRIEGLINRFRIVFMAVLCLFDVSTFIFLGKINELSLYYILMYLGPIAGYVIIQFIIRSGKYMPWIKYHTVTADFLGTTAFTVIYLSNPDAQYPITTKEMLICMSMILLFFNTLSLYRGFKEIVIYSSVISLAANIFIFVYAGFFMMMGLYTTILMLNFSLFFIWAGDKIIRSVISNSQLQQAMDEIKEANQEIIQQNEEISTQRDEIEAKSKIIELKNNETRQSIEYSLRIQKALLPDINYINNFLPDSFIFYKPKDIVSGDFYWIKYIDGNLLIAAADCTGHGVPGAFMSLIGAEKLNDAIDHTTHVGEILKQLNMGVKSALHQDETDTSTRDGMDIALCCYEPATKKLFYAGANRPLWIIRNNNLIETKATKTAIGGLTSLGQEFEVTEINMQAGEMFYVFSDGFADQFGGHDGKKMMTKRFKEFLLRINTLSMQEQKGQVEKHFHEWKGCHEQVDDVLVIGVKI